MTPKSFLRLLSRMLLSVAVLIGPGFALAQVQQQTEEREEPQATMSEAVYKRLSIVHEQMGNEKYDDALRGLGSLEKRSLSPYENALVLQTYGFIYAQRGNFNKAIPYFEESLATDALPNVAQQGMLYSLAGLYASQNQFQKTIDTLTIWFKYEKEPKPEAYILMGSSYAELKRYNEALPYVKKAIETSDKPQESWYQLELAIYFEQKQYQKAADLLRTMIAKWPDKTTYWDTLSGAYQELKQDQRALATMTLAYEKGLVGEERKLLNLVRMHMFLDLPYEAGKLLEKEMSAGRIQATQKNLELLLSAWTQSREFDKAIGVIDRIAPMTDNGDYYIEKAKMYSEKGDWENVVVAARQAVEKGNLKKPGGAYLLMGMAQAELADYQGALESLAQAKKFDDDTRRQADGWIDYVNDRKQIAVARR